VEEVPIGAFRQVMETNFFGGLRCIKAVIPCMRERRQGCIVNVTSVAGRVAMAPQAAYAASKWAFEALSECLAHEMKAFNVRVVIIALSPHPYSAKGDRSLKTVLIHICGD
jgi:NAD(P)-dependent dehydrogenase (short-subunit alcohol dehydrogenase family)